MAKTPTPEEMERKYREDNDARTLADADAIRANPDRMKGAQVGAKRIRAAQPRSTEEMIAALGGPDGVRAAYQRPSLPFASAPGELDPYPVGQAPGEAEAFSRIVAAMATPRVHRDTPRVEHDPGAALATMRS